MHKNALECVWEKTTPISGKNYTPPNSEFGAELEALTACFFEAHSFGVPFDVLPCFVPAHVHVGFGGVVLCAEVDVEACGEVAVVEDVFVDVWEVVAPQGLDLRAVEAAPSSGSPAASASPTRMYAAPRRPAATMIATARRVISSLLAIAARSEAVATTIEYPPAAAAAAPTCPVSMGGSSVARSNSIG